MAKLGLSFLAVVCSDLATCVRRTTGQKPPGLVGFSSTVIGDKLYIFGGRLVNVRRMVNDLWALDLNNLIWEKLWPTSVRKGDTSRENGHMDDLESPQPRYFHRSLKLQLLQENPPDKL